MGPDLLAEVLPVVRRLHQDRDLAARLAIGDPALDLVTLLGPSPANLRAGRVRRLSGDEERGSGERPNPFGSLADSSPDAATPRR